MLGIVFTGGDGPAPETVKRLIDKEAKGAFLVAADSGFSAMERAGFQPDWVIGDMDSLDDPSRLDALPPERVIRFPHDKDFTDTELAFSHAVDRGCDDIWIIGGGGGRLDHLFGIRSLFERDIFPRRWITSAEDVRCIDTNISEVVDNGAVVSVFPLGAGPWEAKSDGLKWPLDDVRWNRGFFGLSNVAVNGGFSIDVKLGRFMVILPIRRI